MLWASSSTSWLSSAATGLLINTSVSPRSWAPASAQTTPEIGMFEALTKHSLHAEQRKHQLCPSTLSHVSLKEMLAQRENSKVDLSLKDRTTPRVEKQH